MSLFPRSIFLMGLVPTFAFIAAADSFTFTDLVPVPATFSSMATGINDAGQIVGSFGLYSGGTFTAINDPSASSASTLANGINNAGQIVGHYTDATGYAHGFLDTGGTFTTIDDPSAAIGSYGTFADTINDAGQIVGYYYDADSLQHGFLDNGGTFTNIDDPLSSGDTVVTGINDAGEIVGYYIDQSGISHGFLDNGGVFTTLDDPLAGTSRGSDLQNIGTMAEGINNAGQIVGFYVTQQFGVYGFVYNSGSFTTVADPSAFYGLSFAFTGPVANGTYAGAINDEGEIAGYYTLMPAVSEKGETQYQAFLATQTASPEPSTLAMMFAAFLGIAGCSRKWRLSS